MFKPVTFEEIEDYLQKTEIVAATESGPGGRKKLTWHPYSNFYAVSYTMKDERGVTVHYTLTEALADYNTIQV